MLTQQDIRFFNSKVADTLPTLPFYAIYDLQAQSPLLGCLDRRNTGVSGRLVEKIRETLARENSY